MLLCRRSRPGTQLSCQNNNEGKSRVAPGPKICGPEACEAEEIGHLREVLSKRQTWMFILLGWRGILCNYDALFTLEAIISAPMITVCAGSANTHTVHFECFCAFVDDSEILKHSEPCSQPPGGEQEHLATVLGL